MSGSGKRSWSILRKPSLEFSTTRPAAYSAASQMRDESGVPTWFGLGLGLGLG